MKKLAINRFDIDVLSPSFNLTGSSWGLLLLLLFSSSSSSSSLFIFSAGLLMLCHFKHAYYHWAAKVFLCSSVNRLDDSLMFSGMNSFVEDDTLVHNVSSVFFIISLVTLSINAKLAKLFTWILNNNKRNGQ